MEQKQKDGHENVLDGWKPLMGGNVNTVARKGDVVRRRIGPASPAVHQLLTWLHARGFTEVPRLIATTQEHEFLTFLPGHAVFRPWPDEVKTTAWMTQLGSWLRRYHDVVTGFSAQDDTPFLWGPSKPEPGMSMCHGDLGPWNCIQQGGRLIGVIDWDLARYGNPLDDVAELALEAVPLRSNLERTVGPSTSRSALWQRLEAFCEGYGALQPSALQPRALQPRALQPKQVIEHVPVYLNTVVRETRRRAELGLEPFASFLAGGIVDELERDRAFVLNEWVPTLPKG